MHKEAWHFAVTKRQISKKGEYFLWIRKMLARAAFCCSARPYALGGKNLRVQAIYVTKRTIYALLKALRHHLFFAFTHKKTGRHPPQGDDSLFVRQVLCIF